MCMVGCGVCGVGLRCRPLYDVGGVEVDSPVKHPVGCTPRP